MFSPARGRVCKPSKPLTSKPYIHKSPSKDLGVVLPWILLLSSQILKTWLIWSLWVYLQRRLTAFLVRLFPLHHQGLAGSLLTMYSWCRSGLNCVISGGDLQFMAAFGKHLLIQTKRNQEFRHHLYCRVTLNRILQDWKYFFPLFFLV